MVLSMTMAGELLPPSFKADIIQQLQSQLCTGNSLVSMHCLILSLSLGYWADRIWEAKSVVPLLILYAVLGDSEEPGCKVLDFG